MIGFELLNKTELLEWVFSNRNKSINGFSNVKYSGITTLLMSKIIAKIICDFPNLYGLYNVSSKAISKYYLVKKINDIFDLNINVEPFEVESLSDKSLESSSFFKKTGIKIDDWDTMLIKLRDSWLKNKHIYED